MSVTEPALQTVPKTGLVRDAFVAREDHKLVLCDYDNEELRVAAHFSGDEAMLAAFSEGRNLHMESAVRLYGADCNGGEHSSKCPHYKLGKAAMFGKAYGAGIGKFGYATGLPPEEATRVFRALDAMYPGLARAMADVTMKIRDRAGEGNYGWVQLVDGRHLKVPADKPYMGFNYLIQGSCASVLKRSLVDLDLAGLGDFIVLPVHDEVVFDVPTDRLDEVVPEIRRTMTRTDFRAPLTVDAKIVDRWGEPYRQEAF
jgi:DNA polymerase-1